jgi:endogenous inhibitor of DNA gyrase (YacG/DUF329 family)
LTARHSRFADRAQGVRIAPPLSPPRLTTMHHDIEPTVQCPTCGHPTQVFLLPAPTVRCPRCATHAAATEDSHAQPEPRGWRCAERPAVQE